ncbi:MAG: RusA family crossover junction endodeoxyribonuclease [Firmicutes bacterium]|nr:RusA family crossover junction endodeoxyribonuclease [Bacillota bacterium]
MNRISFTVYGQAQTKGSAKAFTFTDKNGKTRASITNDNPKSKEWQSLVAKLAQEHRPEGGIIKGAVVVGIDFYFLRPKSVPVKKRPHMIVKPDIDKITRSVLDGLKGTIYADDAQVIGLNIRKYYGDPPRAEIMIIEVGDGIFAEVESDGGSHEAAQTQKTGSHSS